MSIKTSIDHLEKNCDGNKRGRKKKEKLTSLEEEGVIGFWDEFYNELKTNTTEDNTIKIFISLNFMIILSENREEIISNCHKDTLDVKSLCDEVERYLYFKKIKINLYENILNDYNKNVYKSSLDRYIKKFFKIINDYENIEKKFKVYILTKFYTIMINEIKVSYNLICLIKELLRNVKFNSIYDPAIGTGNIISEVIKNHNVDIIEGQDISEFEVNITKMHLILNERENAANSIYIGNSIINPLNIIKGNLKKFDCIVCNPPLNGEWGANVVKDNDKFNRFHRGIPPKNLPSFAYITHIVESLSDNGLGVVVVPQGVLFRDGSEESIRRQLVEEGIVDTIIYLPHNMMVGTHIPINIMILNKAKKDRDVFIIDLTEYGTTKNGKTVLSEDFIDEIAYVYESKLKIENMSDMIPYEMLKDNDFNLYSKRYIYKANDEEEYNYDEIASKIMKIKDELAELNSELCKIIMLQS